jgi:hypothetical protein
MANTLPASLAFLLLETAVAVKVLSFGHSMKVAVLLASATSILWAILICRELPAPET